MSEKYNKALNVVLDIDETLVYFINQRYTNNKASKWNQPIWEGANEQKYNKEEQLKKYKYKELGGQKEKAGHIVMFRPHLATFFTWLLENCNICFWTWSDYEYAVSIRDLINEHVFQQSKLTDENSCILCGDDAQESMMSWDNAKDLNWIWWECGQKRHPMFANFHESNTVLIDDLPGNAINTSNMRNSITVNPFGIFGERKDREGPYEDVSKDNTLELVTEFLQNVAIPRAKSLKTVDLHTKIFSGNFMSVVQYEKYIRHIKVKDGKKNIVVPIVNIGGNAHFKDKCVASCEKAGGGIKNAREHSAYLKSTKKHKGRVIYIDRKTHQKYVKTEGEYVKLSNLISKK